jgi:hypothetical protein
VPFLRGCEFPKSLAITSPEGGGLLIPMEVVLRGCGNSGSEGGKEGGSLLVPSSPTLPLYPELTKSKPFIKNGCPSEDRVERELTFAGWTDGPPPGGLTNQRGEVRGVCIRQ